jgi:ubiquinone/menaquinone biosynthesis C-methylase UbiE
MSPHPNVTAHYGRHGELSERILAVLDEDGKPTAPPRLEDLRALDQFHNRGHEATAELASVLAAGADDLCLDIGCGLGGPARQIADTGGCRVEGVDLTPEFIATAEALTQLVGLSGRVGFTCADACRLPFEDGHFTAAFTQHAAMNIADKSALYREAHRVLQPGGRFAVYDVVAGPVAGDLVFPLPWASQPETSHLLDAEAVRDLVEQTGFTCQLWADRTAEAMAWATKAKNARAAAQAAGKPPPLSPARYLGSDLPIALGNMARGLESGHLQVVMGLFLRI